VVTGYRLPTGLGSRETLSPSQEIIYFLPEWRVVLYVVIHYFRATMRKGAGIGGRASKPGKTFEIISAKSCILAPSGLRKWPGEFDVKIILDVALTEYGEHCCSAPKVGEQLLTPHPCSDAPVLW